MSIFGVNFVPFSSLLPHFHWSAVSHVRLGRLPRRNWKPVKASKKRKTTTDISAIGNPVTEKQRWLQELPLSNSFNSLTEEIDADPVNKTTIQTNHITKPPPIFVEAQIIDPLIDLLNNLEEKNNYTIK